jgi:hypothetical protein
MFSTRNAVPIGDRGVEALEDANHPRGLGGRLVAGAGDEIHLGRRPLQMPEEIGAEHEGTLEDAHHQ